MTENSISTCPCFLSISAQMLFVSTNMKECWLCKTFCWSSPLLRKNSHCVCFKSHRYLCTCSKIITNHNKSWQKRFSEMISWEFPRTAYSIFTTRACARTLIRAKSIYPIWSNPLYKEITTCHCQGHHQLPPSTSSAKPTNIRFQTA